MDISVFSPRQLDTVFRALRTALCPAGALAPPERAFLDAYARINAYSYGPGDPEPIRPREVALDGAHQRKRLVQLAALAALLHRPVRTESAAFVRALARQLDTPEPVIPVLEALSKGQKGKARLLTARRGLAGILGEAHRAEGTLGVLRFAAALLFRWRVNKDSVWKYKRLGLLPEGTFGREIWRHITELGYGFPGEPGGIPDTVVYHDVGHVLADHDTTPVGEIQQGCFQAGNRHDDGFFFAQFAILQFHHGIKLTPAAAPEVGYYDPEKVLWAIHRGAACNVDITHQWDFWPLMPLPLSEARERCALLPRLADQPQAA